MRFEVELHKILGSGLLESVYEEALVYELNSVNIKCDRQKNIAVN